MMWTGHQRFRKRKKKFLLLTKLRQKITVRKERKRSTKENEEKVTKTPKASTKPIKAQVTKTPESKKKADTLKVFKTPANDTSMEVEDDNEIVGEPFFGFG